MLLERCSLARLVCAKVDVFGAKPTNRHNQRFSKSKKSISLPQKQTYSLHIKYVFIKIHRTIHELCTLLLEIVTQIFVIKIVPNNMISAVNGHCAVGIFSFSKCTPVSSKCNVM